MFVFNKLVKYYEIFVGSIYLIRIPGTDDSICKNRKFPYMLLRRKPDKIRRYKYQSNWSPFPFKNTERKNLLHVYICGSKNGKLSIETILYGSSTDILSIQIPLHIVSYIKYRKFKKRNKVLEYFKKEQYTLDPNFIKSIHMDMCCFADKHYHGINEFMHYDIDYKNCTFNKWHNANYDV